jgi:AraC-like DNA-binding protein
LEEETRRAYNDAMEWGFLEALFRGIAIGALGAVALGLWRGPDGPARLGGTLFCLGVAAYALNSSPALFQSLGWFAFPVHFLALGGQGLFWLFIVTLFEDRAVSPLTLAPWALLTAIGLLGLITPPPWVEGVWIAHNLVEAAFSVHALILITRSWRGDLVEARRRLRGPFLAAVTLFVLILSGVEIAQSFGVDPWWYGVASGAGLAVFCTAGAAVFLQSRPELFGAAGPAPAEAAEDERLALAERAALAKLTALMSEGEAWRREGLTIGALAQEVGVPEHRLRRLINDRLGHRNFAAFVNARRIEAAKAQLMDPAHAQRSVSAIAFELGFGSLGPFNRAFKEATGLTPSEWRRRPDSPIPEIPR